MNKEEFYSYFKDQKEVEDIFDRARLEAILDIELASKPLINKAKFETEVLTNADKYEEFMVALTNVFCDLIKTKEAEAKKKYRPMLDEITKRGREAWNMKAIMKIAEEMKVFE